MVHMPSLNVAEHFASSSRPTEMRVNAISGYRLLEYGLGALRTTSPFPSALSLGPSVVVMVVLLIGE